MAYSTWYQMDFVARRNIERLTKENQAHSLDFGAKFFSKYLSATTRMSRQIATTIALTPRMRTADLSDFSVIEKEIAPLILSTLESSPNVSWCHFQTHDGLITGYRRFDDGRIRHIFANQSSAPPRDPSGITKVPLYFQSVDPFGNPTAKPFAIIGTTDFRCTEPYRETMTTGAMAWGLIWAMNTTLVFLSAQVVKDPVSNATLGVAFGTSTADTLTQLLASIRPEHAGLLYVSEAYTEKVIASSDLTGTYDPALMTSLDVTLKALNTSNRLMRESARFLSTPAARQQWPATGIAQFHSVPLAGEGYYISGATMEVESRILVTVMAVPRSVIWDDIDQTSLRELIIISSITAGVLLLGCVLTVLLTCRVSREMLLRAELIHSLQLKDRAEKASDYKSQFLAAMSHDVRTPLCCIIGLLEVLLGDGRLHSEQRSSLKQVRLCALQLLDLLKSILDLHKVESGKLSLEAGPFDLGQELEALVDMFAVQSAKKGVALVLDLDDGVPRRVVGDCARVRQILANLVGNAVTFTNEGHIVVRASVLPDSPATTSTPKPIHKVFRTLIRVASKKLSSRVESLRRTTIVFEVDDTGVGIPPSRRTEVLGSFTQGSRHSGGYGLGLAMVKNLVSLMGGAIRIEDKAEPGSLFRFHIVLGLPPEDSPDGNGSFFGTPEAAFKALGNQATGAKSSQVAALPSAAEPRRPEVRRMSSTASASDFPRRERSILSRVEGTTVLLLKGDPAGRAAAAAWMTRRGLRVHVAERWGGLRETFTQLLSSKHSARIETVDEDADLSTDRDGRPQCSASNSTQIRKPSRLWPSESDATPSEIAPPGPQLFVQPPRESGSSKQSNRGNFSGSLLLILDTSVVPGFPCPEALSVTLRSLLGDYDRTAPNAPRVAVAWLVSFALPGAMYEEMRAASGCGIIAYDVLHPSRLLSLLTAMLSDNRNPDALLGTAVPASPPVESENGLPKGRPFRKPVVMTEDERQELMIQSGIAFAATRGAVDEKGPETPTDWRTPSLFAERTASASSETRTMTTRLATMSIREPRAANPPPAEASVSQEVTGEKQPGKVKATGKPGGEPGGEGLPLAGVHILIVEDTVLLRKLATTILTRVGARVFAVENGRQAVNAILAAMELQLNAQKAPPSLSEFGPPADALAEALRTSGCFDLVLMDCQMPVLDGYGATTEIRELEKGEKVHVPIVALTAHAMATDKEKCLGVGMDGYLTKPINMPLLVSTIKSFVKQGALT
ncbi:histidine kinase [Klebsormidium nitens]|uniref:histidine kinase n=1 Tax=Klebsormidium nitens TaxID=105231 RepID=A0A1Y1I487_KLENI|nr:histidine kinase [Klebsormidium nitens]|eukprot:GAQ83546.1 histidine kinase [Klebsormidium nitens]